MAGGGAGASWQTETNIATGPSKTQYWQWSTGSQQNNQTSSNYGGYFTWQDLMREIMALQVRGGTQEFSLCAMRS